jgi:hypothetical protein
VFDEQRHEAAVMGEVKLSIIKPRKVSYGYRKPKRPNVISNISSTKPSKQSTSEERCHGRLVKTTEERNNEVLEAGKEIVNGGKHKLY